MNSKAFLTLGIIIAAAGVNTSAAIVPQDWHTSGDGLLTYDTTNHREWLDLTQTDVLPFATVQQSLAPGESLSGFHIANVDDVHALVTSAGYVGVQQSDQQYFSIATQLIDDLGECYSIVTETQTYDPPGYDHTLPPADTLTTRYSIGWVLTDSPSNTFASFSIYAMESDTTAVVRFGNTRSSYAGTDTQIVLGENLAQYGGVWLYRDAPVPEPTTLTLLALTICAASLSALQAIGQSPCDPVRQYGRARIERDCHLPHSAFPHSPLGTGRLSSGIIFFSGKTFAHFYFLVAPHLFQPCNVYTQFGEFFLIVCRNQFLLGSPKRT